MPRVCVWDDGCAWMLPAVQELYELSTGSYWQPAAGCRHSTLPAHQPCPPCLPATRAPVSGHLRAIVHVFFSVSCSSTLPAARWQPSAGCPHRTLPVPQPCPPCLPAASAWMSGDDATSQGENQQGYPHVLVQCLLKHQSASCLFAGLSLLPVQYSASSPALPSLSACKHSRSEQGWCRAGAGLEYMEPCHTLST